MAADELRITSRTPVGAHATSKHTQGTARHATVAPGWGRSSPAAGGAAGWAPFESCPMCTISRNESLQTRPETPVTQRSAAVHWDQRPPEPADRGRGRAIAEQREPLQTQQATAATRLRKPPVGSAPRPRAGRRAAPEPPKGPSRRRPGCTRFLWSREATWCPAEGPTRDPSCRAHSQAPHSCPKDMLRCGVWPHTGGPWGVVRREGPLCVLPCGRPRGASLSEKDKAERSVTSTTVYARKAGNTRTRAHTHTGHACTRALMHMHTHTCAPKHMQSYVCTRVHRHTPFYTYTDTCSHIYRHTGICLFLFNERIVHTHDSFLFSAASAAG